MDGFERSLRVLLAIMCILATQRATRLFVIENENEEKEKGLEANA
jgi:hypothetical protein